MAFSSPPRRSHNFGTRRQEITALRELLEWLAPLSKLLGLFIMLLGCFMLLPSLLLAWEKSADTQAFFIALGITLGCGAGLTLLGSLTPFYLRGRQIFVLTSLGWLVLSLFAALPFMLASTQLSFIDALFESVSGLTTTGSTILTNLEQQSSGILLWRGLLQWLGGIGIIVLGMAILPFLQVGGMRLFQSESSDWSDKALPRSQVLAKAIGKVYLGLTSLCIFSYWLAGMQPFDALVHGLTTSATGGFSNYDDSLGFFAQQPAILWVGVVFMFLGSLPFVVFVQLTQGRWKPLWKDSQIRALSKLLVVAILLMTLYLILHTDWSLCLAITQAAFNVVSIVSTSGFSGGDFSTWGSFATLFFLYLMFIGGCSGSTSGGFKIFRHQLALILMRNQLKTLLHPRGVFSQRYNGKHLSNEVINSMVAFAFFFFATIACLALALAFMGLDFLTSFTSAVTAVANIGPGLGAQVGPAGNFADLPSTAKVLLSFGMLLGRLEILTFMVLFTRAFWRT